MHEYMHSTVVLIDTRGITKYKTMEEEIFRTEISGNFQIAREIGTIHSTQQNATTNGEELQEVWEPCTPRRRV